MDVKLGSSAGTWANRRCVDGVRPPSGHVLCLTRPRSAPRAPACEVLASRVKEIVQAFIFTI